MKVRRQLTIVLATLLMLAGLVEAQNQNTVATDGTTLRWKLAPGQVFDVEIVQDTNQLMQYDEQQTKITNNMTTNFVWTVQSVDETGIATIQQVIDRVRMSVDSPQAQFSYDSQAEKHSPLAQHVSAMFGPMIGVQFIQTMNTRGDILDLKVPDEALAGVKANPMAAQFLSAEMIKEMTSKTSPVLPEGPTSVGQTWTQSGNSKTPVGAVNVKSTYTYSGKSEEHPELDSIHVRMEMAFEPGNGAQAGAASPQLDVQQQNNEGTLLFDSEAGYLVRSKLNQQMKLNVNIGQVVQQQIESTTTMSVARR